MKTWGCSRDINQSKVYTVFSHTTLPSPTKNEQAASSFFWPLLDSLAHLNVIYFMFSSQSFLPPHTVDLLILLDFTAFFGLCAYVFVIFNVGSQKSSG